MRNKKAKKIKNKRQGRPLDERVYCLNSAGNYYYSWSDRLSANGAQRKVGEWGKWYYGAAYVRPFIG